MVERKKAESQTYPLRGEAYDHIYQKEVESLDPRYREDEKVVLCKPGYYGFNLLSSTYDQRGDGDGNVF